jgi:hypothetical protein
LYNCCIDYSRTVQGKKPEKEGYEEFIERSPSIPGFTSLYSSNYSSKKALNMVIKMEQWIEDNWTRGSRYECQNATSVKNVEMIGGSPLQDAQVFVVEAQPRGTQCRHS